MYRDEVCILCGIRSYDGPSWLGETAETIAQIADDVEGFADRRLVPTEVFDVISEIWVGDVACLDSSYLTSLDPGYSKECIAIGHFDGRGGYEPCRHAGRALHPPGGGVQVRRVAGEDATPFRTHVEVVRGVGACNIWLHVACWGHLQHWLACRLPPRTGRDGEPLSLAGELYEITASRSEPQDVYNAHLPAIDYGGTLDAFMGTEYQDCLLGTRRSAKHLVHALEAGLRGADLVPALIEYLRVWIWVRPDMWPNAPHAGPHEVATIYSADPAQQPHAALCTLPNELLPELLQYCELDAVFALAATCRDLRTRVLARSTLAYALHLAAENRASPLRWVLPVPNLRKEYLAACDAMSTWLPAGPTPPPTFSEMEFEEDEEDADSVPAENESDEDVEDESDEDVEDESDEDVEDEVNEYEDEDVLDDLTLPILDVPIPLPPDPTTLPLPPLPLFDDPAFPLAAFLAAFRTSASMRARRRRWGLVKQWDRLFTDYRRDGWERDVFTPPETTWAQSDYGLLQCQCKTTESA